MAKEENNNKRSNVIYIDRNKKSGKAGTKPKSTPKKGSSAPVKNVTHINKKRPADKPASVEKNKPKKSNTTNQKKKKPKKSGRKIYWGRVAVAVLLVVAIGFGAFKGIQRIKSKKSQENIAATNSSEEVGSSEDNKNNTSKGQYDLNDEEKRQSKKYNIVVDAGHGGNDKGSIDSTGTIYEKDISLQIAKKIASRLGRESDVNVVMTRTEDKYVSLEERAEIAKKANADALISVHLNAQKKYGDANGLETWYRGGATDGSKELAASVQKTTASYVEITSRGILRNNFEILRETTMPAVLIECGFITNVSDMEKIKNPNYQDMLAEGIMQGTLSFLDEKNRKN